MSRCETCSRDFVHQEALDAHNKSKHNVVRKPFNKTLIIGLVAVVVLIAFIVSFVGKGKAETPTGAVIGTVQEAELRTFGMVYVLTPSTFKKDVPVKITANVNALPGCSKSVTIPAFGVYKTVDAGDNEITFTPTASGTFKIACSMNMYRGTFTVE